MWETDMNGDNYDDDDDDDDDGGDKEGSGRILGGLSSDAELYQLWLNLPPERKLCEPRIQLVTPTADDNVNTRPPPPQVPAGAAPIQVVDLPTILVQGGSTRSGGSSGDGSGRVGSSGGGGGSGGGITRVRVLSGSGVHGVDSGTETASPVTILHSTLGPGSTWALSLPPAFTAILYVRSGEVAVGADGEGTSPGGGSSSSSRGVATVVGVHELAHLTKGGDGIVLRNANQAEEADVMVFAGLPLGAPVVASGTMVMNSEAEVARALEDYQRGDFGLPWDHEMPDDSWRAGVSAWKKRGA
jgi:redox-sensitive bicupin YhaK (pirin superfamily)